MGPEDATNSTVFRWDSGTLPYSTQYVVSSVTNDTPDVQSPVAWSVNKQTGLNPVLYFKYVKSKFNFIERKKIEDRLKLVEKAFDAAVEAGQDLLAEKFLNSLNLAMKESLMLAKGVTKYIDRDVLCKHKHNIRGGHISNTMLKDYTRVIPKKVLEKLSKVKDIFDGIEIWHYWNEQEQQKIAKKQKMSAEEKDKMRDPVMFGLIKGSNNVYFIDEWADEYCDLTFDELVKVVGSKERHTITKKPTLLQEEK